MSDYIKHNIKYQSELFNSDRLSPSSELLVYTHVSELQGFINLGWILLYLTDMAFLKLWASLFYKPPDLKGSFDELSPKKNRIIIDSKLHFIWLNSRVLPWVQTGVPLSVRRQDAAFNIHGKIVKSTTVSDISTYSPVVWCIFGVALSTRRISRNHVASLSKTTNKSFLNAQTCTLMLNGERAEMTWTQHRGVRALCWRAVAWGNSWWFQSANIFKLDGGKSVN